MAARDPLSKCKKNISTFLKCFFSIFILNVAIIVLHVLISIHQINDFLVYV